METIRVIHLREPEGRWAESPDVPGWSAAGESYDGVRALGDEGIAIAAGPIEHVVPSAATLTA
ncbi:MAG TPA: hypothetical protein VH063_01100 [Gaiellaceae bacterium]|jgi:predicted RNase H-like HicB family nuclease|nr:hypothetical protein [Gaiellaceae bacterium]